MSTLRCGISPSRLPIARMCAAAIWLALAVAGCASQKAARQPHAGDPDPSLLAKVDKEADGQPAQPPPSISIRAIPDDPREPWSRNYGSIPPARRAAEPTTMPPAMPLPSPVPPAPSPSARAAVAPASLLPSDLPPDFRRKLADAGIH